MKVVIEISQTQFQERRRWFGYAANSIETGGYKIWCVFLYD